MIKANVAQDVRKVGRTKLESLICCFEVLSTVSAFGGDVSEEQTDLCHTFGLCIGLPRLWFENEMTAFMQHGMNFAKEGDETVVALVKVYPFRDRQAGDTRQSRI